MSTASPNTSTVGLNPAADARAGDGPDTIDESTAFVGNGRLLQTGDWSDVTILIGAKKKPYKLHKAILCQNSGYFKAILKKNAFREGEENVISLQEFAQFDFEQVLHWLYCGTVKPTPNGEPYWSIGIYAKMLRASTYFDIPSLKQRMEISCVEMIRDKGIQQTFAKGGRHVPSFLAGVKILFELFSTEKRAISPIIRALSEENYIPQVLLDKDLREVLLQEPELTVRLLDLKWGVEWKGDAGEENN